MSIASLPTASATHPEIGVIGIGLLGSALSRRLLENGYRVHVWNRTFAEAEPIVQAGAVWCDAPLIACDRWLVSLYTSEIVTEVLARFSAQLRPGLLLIDTTTSTPEESIALAQKMSAQGVGYLEAPISGSSEQARRGEVTMLLAGEQSLYESCADLWSILSRRVFYLGAAGSAAKLKLVSNLVLGLNRLALAEGLVFAQALHLPGQATLAVLKESAAYSRAMDVKGMKMLDQDFSVQAKLSQHLKDVRLILEAAQGLGLSLPTSELHRQLLERAEAAGLGELDNSAIIQVVGQA